MSVSKYFQSLTRKYHFLSPNICFTKLASRSYSKIIDVNHRIPSHYLSVLPNCYTVNYYSSQASRAEPIQKECPSIHTVMQSIKFDNLSFEPSVPHEELLAALQKCATLTEQMETLASTMALSSEDIENRRKFCKTLELFFKPFFSDFKIQMFGSTVNYFGFKGCDIDMTFETSVQPKDETSYLERPDVPLVSEVISGKVSPQEISELPFKEQLIFMHNVLLEYYKESSEPSIFIEAHVPLVRFYHDKFNLKCDLTFKNKVAFANTKLLYFYAKLDKRVVPIIMTIRYWAKHIDLIGKGLQFNTYTVTLLVIHFLQTRDPPVIPSAESILSLSKNFETDDMDDISFLSLIEKIPPSSNTQPLDELLKQFFFYYLYFDFTRVIVPLTGTSVPRKEFISTKDRKFVINTLCVQDPLCISHNVADLVEHKMARKLYTECLTACRMIQDNVISTPTSGTWGLINILDKPSRYDFRNVDVGKPVLLTLPYVCNKSINDGISQRMQASLTAKMLMKVLTHVLLFECTHVEEEKIIGILEKLDRKVAIQKKQLESRANMIFELRKLRKDKVGPTESYERQMEMLSGETGLEQFKKCKAENELILCCKCKISKNVWTGRQFVKLNPASLPLDILNREHLISKEVVEQNEQNSEDQKKKSYEYLFECYIASNTSEPSILVNFRPLQKTDFNLVLAVFLRDYIPKIMSSPDI